MYEAQAQHKDKLSNKSRKHVEMATEDKHHPRYSVNEQGEHEEKKMSVNCLLNDVVDVKRNGLYHSSSEIARLSDSFNLSKDNERERPGSAYDDQYIEYIEGSPPTTPTVTAQLPQRAPCSVCKSETGRCHASDPSTMQTFFSNTLGFEGVLNVADWLCMKCYSKWYNRCKRKASSGLSLSVVDSSMPLPQKRKRREKEKDHLPKVEGEKKDSDRDTDSDDALLLARIGGNYPLNSSNGTSDESPDLDSASIEELRSEVVRLRKDMRKMVGDIAQRDEQIEGMMSFVRNEISSMHNLLKEIHTSKWTSPSTTSPSSSNAHPLSASCNNLPSLSSLPLSFSVPSLHN